MSSPGNWGSNEYGQYDPITGAPIAGGPGGSTPQPGAQYQGFGAFSQPQQPPQQPQQQHPQPPQQPVHPGYPAQPAPPGKSRGPLIAAIALASVAVIAIVTTIVVLSTSGGPSVASPPPPRTSAPTKPTNSAPPPTSGVANPNLTPVVDGWQVVTAPKRGAVYDVPAGPGWKLDPNPENIHAFGPPDDPVTMTGVADYLEGFCTGDPGSFRATTGVSARRGPDDTTVANETAQKLAELAYVRDGNKPLVVLGPPEQVQLTGGIPAVRVTARVTLMAPGPCDSKNAAVSVLATNSDGQSSMVFLAVADQDVPDAIPVDTLNKITQSLRQSPK
ncbi:hypothetical protein AB0L88_02395 [Saccharopolyspora shandongensis]|uniref:hypothetical protein n=1 Tax=Saccharopolyspora shandongensis TaxID=418495 RepID=UPI0034181056